MGVGYDCFGGVLLAKGGAVVVVAHTSTVLQDRHHLRIRTIEAVQLGIVAVFARCLKSIRHLSVFKQHFIRHHWIRPLVDSLIRLSLQVV